MNVAPGDMAKVIGTHDAHGSVVEVLGAASPDDVRRMHELTKDWALRHVWEVKMFSGGAGWGIDSGKRMYMMPGSTAFIADEFLKRIDPQRDPAYDHIVEETHA